MYPVHNSLFKSIGALIFQILRKNKPFELREIGCPICYFVFLAIIMLLYEILILQFPTQKLYNH